MDDGIERALALIDPAQDRRGDFAEIGEINQDARADRIGQLVLIEIEYVVAMGDEIAQHGAAQFAAAAGYQHFHLGFLLGLAASVSRHTGAAKMNGF